MKTKCYTNEVLFLLVFVGFFIMTGCGKDEAGILDQSNPETVNVQELNGVDLKSINGVMCFESFEDLHRAIIELNALATEERVAIEERIGFKSQRTLFFDIHKAEDEHIESYYSDVNPDLDEMELNKLGIKYTPSETYQKFLNQGMIYETKEEDGSISFQLTLECWGLTLVADKNANVFVNEELIDLNEYVKRTTVNQKSSNNDFEVYDRETRSTWSSTSPRYSDPHANYRRVQVFIVGNSLRSSLRTLSSSYTVEIITERRVFGRWRTRNSYMPIRKVTGSWYYSYIYTNSSGGSFITGRNDLPLATPPPLSNPLNFEVIKSNYMKLSLQPTGIFSQRGSGEFHSPIYMGPRSFVIHLRQSSKNWRITYNSYNSTKWARLSN